MLRGCVHINRVGGCYTSGTANGGIKSRLVGHVASVVRLHQKHGRRSDELFHGNWHVQGVGTSFAFENDRSKSRIDIRGVETWRVTQLEVVFVDGHKVVILLSLIAFKHKGPTGTPYKRETDKNKRGRQWFRR